MEHGVYISCICTLVAMLLGWLAYGLSSFRKEFRTAIDQVYVKMDRKTDNQDFKDCRTICCYQNQADIKHLEATKINKVDSDKAIDAIWRHLRSLGHSKE